MPQSPSGFQIGNILPVVLLKNFVIMKFVNDFCVRESTPIAAGRCPSRLIYSQLMPRPIGSTHGGGRVLTRVNYFLSPDDEQTYNNNGNNNNITRQLQLLRYLQRFFLLSLFWFLSLLLYYYFFFLLFTRSNRTRRRRRNTNRVEPRP